MPLRNIPSQHTVHSLILMLLLALLSACGGGSGSDSDSDSDSAPDDETTAYYIDAVDGDDGNSGGDPSSPWKTLSRISAEQLPAGTVIYLKRGATWHEQLTLHTPAITVDAYGQGTAPEIDGSITVEGWRDQGNGVFAAGINLGEDEALGNLSENGALMTFLEWQGDAASTFSGTVTGSFSYDNATATLFIKPDTAPSGNSYRASTKPFGILASAVSDITVRNIKIRRFSLHGINFKDCVRCEVHDSIVTEGGGAIIGPSLYAGNGIEYGNASTDGLVHGVVVSDIFDSCISPQTYGSDKGMSNIVIRDSQISTCGLAGVEVSVLGHDGSTGSSIDGVTVSGLTITDIGRGWSGKRYATAGHGMQIRADDGAGTIRNVQIDTTTIENSAGDGVSLSGDIGIIHLARTDISNNTNGLSLEDANATSPKIRLTSSLVHHNSNYGILYNAPKASGMELLQNTLADNAVINLAVQELVGTANIRNNLFYSSSAITDLYLATPLVGAEIDNNCYSDHNNMIGYAGTAYSSVSAFTADTGHELNGLSGDPGLLAPETGDYMLAVSSTCKASGSATVGIELDFSGYPYAVTPSSGAYQFR